MTMLPGCSRRPLRRARPAGPVTAAAGVPAAGTWPVLRRAALCRVGGRPWALGALALALLG